MAENIIITSNSLGAKHSTETKSHLPSILLFLALIVEGYFLVFDLPLTTHPPVNLLGAQGAPVAEMITQKNTVRTQAPGDLVWEPASDGQILFRRQSVLTLDKSKAEIAFLDGTGLVLDENSLIQIEKTPSDDLGGYQKLIVRLLRGTIHKNKPRGSSEILRGKGTTYTPLFEIQVDQTIASIPASAELTITATPENTGGSRISVHAGNVELKTEKGEPVEVKAGQKALISKNAAQPVIQAEAVPIPAPALPKPKAEPVRKAAAVKPLVKKKPSLLPAPAEVNTPEFRRSHPKPNPKHTWLDFFISQALAAEPGAAPDLSWEILLKWKQVEGATGYRIQISRERTFSKVMEDANTLEPHWAWDYRLGMENSRGRVFYRIATLNAIGEMGPFSDAQILLIPPEILSAGQEKKSVPSLVLDAPKAGPKFIAPEEPTPLLPVRTTWHWTGGLDTGMGDLKQKSTDASIASVGTQKPFLQQKFFFTSEITRTTSPSDEIWKVHFEAAVAGFHKPDTTRTTLQPDTKAFTARLDLLRATKSKSPWNLGLGARMERSFRWEKTGPQEVEAHGAISVGPMVSGVRNYGHARQISLAEVGFTLAVPATGIFTSGFIGAEANIWGEWKLISFEKSWIGLRPEAEASYLRWSKPQGTSIASWVFWLAPTIHFGEF